MHTYIYPYALQSELYAFCSSIAAAQVVDVCGSVTSVSLCQGAEAPDPPRQVAAIGDEAEGSEKDPVLLPGIV